MPDRERTAAGFKAATDALDAAGMSRLAAQQVGNFENSLLLTVLGDSILTARAENARLAAYEAEFAPPQRTVEQIARDIVSAHQFKNADMFIPVPQPLMDELAAALARQGG